MKRISLLTVLLTTLLLSCTKDKIEIDPGNLIIGVWNYSEYNDNALVFRRSQGFSDGPGYQFQTDGTLVERKNSGWCGTPPVTYGDYPGKWNIINDTLVQVIVSYWGGTAKYNLDIESVDNDYLKVNTIWLSN